MATTSDCKQNQDLLILIREGTSQDQRYPDALNPDKQNNPDFPRVDERKPEHALVFAKAYSKYLRFYGSDNTVAGDWEAFFGQDVSVQLAIASVQDVDYYKANIKASFDFLNDRSHKVKESELKQHLGYLFSAIGTLAKQLDALKEGLPNETALKSTLQNLIKNQLAPALKRLIAYYKAFPKSDPDFANAHPSLVLLGATTTVFSDICSYNFSKDWITDKSFADWSTYFTKINEDKSVYGSRVGVFERINHIATHNLFTSVFDQFLRAYARVVSDAKLALEETFTKWDGHEPHYALFLSFLKLFDYARAEANTLTQKHLDFYYKEVLKFKEKPAEPGHAHLLVELAKQAGTHEFKKGDLFKAGKDELGIEAFFANDQDFVANHAKVTELKTLYRHDFKLPTECLFALPIANSADGKGAKLTTADQSWHPFFNKTYEDGNLTINLPQAEVGFALASHYLWLAEGDRTITIDFTVTGTVTELPPESQKEIICLVTAEKGWFEIPAARLTEFKFTGKVLRLKITLSGGDPAVTPYSPKTHGDYPFSTNLPVLLVKLRHQDNIKPLPENKLHSSISVKNNLPKRLNSSNYTPYLSIGTKSLYTLLQDLVIETIDLTVAVTGLKSLAVSNDFGPVDTSKPFQPFGASPVAKSALVIGSKEAFQKNLIKTVVQITWQNIPSPYPHPDNAVDININCLEDSKWEPLKIWTQLSEKDAINITNSTFTLSSCLDKLVIDLPDFSELEFYNTGSRHGFISLVINKDFGQSVYEQALIDYIKKVTDNNPTNVNKDSNPDNDDKKPFPPVGPFITQLTLDYITAKQPLLDTSRQADFDERPGRFFHLLPFGHAEQHPFLKIGAADPTLYLFPQFKHLNSPDSNSFDKTLPAAYPVSHEAEFYIGVTGLLPPQNLALFFQVADGTANPLSTNPDIHWSYLSGNEWIAFHKYDVQDGTGGLINSGIITFAIPDKASSTNTLLPAGQHWLRAAVADNSDAVCRLLAVSAQGLAVTFQNLDNDPAYPAKTLPAGTISKLETPDAAVKGISQPFPGFGGRGAEQPSAFYTRISERLRHKDRAITLWDYEHLILEAFPQIYKVKCLNHTEYKPKDGIYRELAPGHLTLITLPNQHSYNLLDSLRPYTSLGLLADIKTFLKKRLSCFFIPDVENPEFEEVGTDFKVRFLGGYDETFYRNKLQEAITRFLSPWAFPGGGSPTFGGKVYQSVLINFVEEQPYVDYVTDFKLSHTYKKFDGTGVTDNDVAEIEAFKAISILVSAKIHTITPIPSSQDETSGKTCPCAT